MCHALLGTVIAIVVIRTDGEPGIVHGEFEVVGGVTTACDALQLRLVSEVAVGALCDADPADSVIVLNAGFCRAGTNADDVLGVGNVTFGAVPDTLLTVGVSVGVVGHSGGL